MKIKNYTGKDILVMDRTEEIYIIKPEGEVKSAIGRKNKCYARITDSHGRQISVKVNETNFSSVATEGLPDEEKDVLLIVPIHTYLCNPHRKDLITTDGTKRVDGKMYVTSFCFKRY
jgi:predicted PilT family ATPase